MIGNGTKRKEDKSMNSSIKTLAIQLMVGVAFTACSSDDDIVNDQPVNPTEPKTYTMTIQASKGDDTTTRGLYFADEDKKNLQVNWNGKEKVRVVQNGAVIGTLSAAMSNGENGHMTTLTGTVTGFQNNQDVGFYLLADENGKMDYTGQKGAMLDDNGTGNIEENYDFASYELTGNQCYQAFEVNGSSIVPKDGIYIPFTSQQAIVCFELQNSSGNDLFATKFIVTDKNAGNKLVQSIDTKTDTKTYGHVTLTPSGLSTSSIYYVAMNLEGNTSDIRLFASDNEGNLYTYEKSNVTFEKGKYYRVKVKMSLCTKFPLKDITSEDTQFTGWYIGTSSIDGDDENYAYKLYSSSVKGVIAYVGKVPGYFDKFLAMSMHDSDNDGNDGSYTANFRSHAQYIGKYATKHPITIGGNAYTASFASYDNGNYFTYDEVTNSADKASNTSNSTRKGWRMPTVTDWRYIFYGLCGEPSPTDPAGVTNNGDLGSSNKLDKLNADNNGYKANLQVSCHYCTSSGVSGENNYVWYIQFYNYNAPVTVKDTQTGLGVCRLRPVFAY